MRKGFTLLELLIVIIIIGILAIFALPQFFQVADTAKRTKARQVLGEIRSAEVICRGLTGSYIAFPITCNAPDTGLPVVTLEDPTAGDAYWTYTLSVANASAGSATATAKNACGSGCGGPYVIDFETGAI